MFKFKFKNRTWFEMCRPRWAYAHPHIQIRSADPNGHPFGACIGVGLLVTIVSPGDIRSQIHVVVIVCIYDVELGEKTLTLDRQ